MIWLLANLNARKSSTDDQYPVSQVQSIRFAAVQRRNQDGGIRSGSFGVSSVFRAIQSVIIRRSRASGGNDLDITDNAVNKAGEDVILDLPRSIRSMSVRRSIQNGVDGFDVTVDFVPGEFPNFPDNDASDASDDHEKVGQSTKSNGNSSLRKF